MASPFIDRLSAHALIGITPMQFRRVVKLLKLKELRMGGRGRGKHFFLRSELEACKEEALKLIGHKHPQRKSARMKR